nr:hypothetical protein [Candidatus Sigynarchaeota archaeon]
MIYTEDVQEALIDEIKYLSTFLPAKAIEKCVLVPLKKVEKFEKAEGIETIATFNPNHFKSFGVDIHEFQ